MTRPSTRASALTAGAIAAALLAVITPLGGALGLAAPGVGGPPPPGGGLMMPPQPTLNCTLVVPPNPLTAEGLATPYRLLATDPNRGPCDEKNPMQAAFVQAAILDPATGALSQYQPLVINAGAPAAVAPTAPTLPANAVVALWFGFEGQTLTLAAADPATLGAAQCINGLPAANGQLASPFGRFAYCNANLFYSTANQQIRLGHLVPPAPAPAVDGALCPTSRDFAFVNQDQGNGLTTGYLVTPMGIAQDTAANRTALAGAVPLTSVGNQFGLALNAALQCTAWAVPDLGDAGAPKPALFANELQAAMFQRNPALVASNVPGTLAGGVPDAAKTNLYRAGLGMPALAGVGAEQAPYCTAFRAAAVNRVGLNQTMFAGKASVNPAVAADFYSFVANRANIAWAQLGCQTISGQNPPFALVAAAPAAP